MKCLQNIDFSLSWVKTIFGQHKLMQINLSLIVDQNESALERLFLCFAMVVYFDAQEAHVQYLLQLC